MSIYYIIMSMIDGFESFINLAVMVLTIVASWIMYAKAGEHGWAAIVPFYSSYVRFRIAGKKKLFWISCGYYRNYSGMYYIDV